MIAIMKVFFLCLLVVFSPSLVFGGYTSCGSNCYLANTPSASDVQSAISAADSAYGGEVRIPAGSATYSSNVTLWSALNHDLKITGAGQGENGTIITDRTTSGSAFSFYVNGTTRFELSNLKLISKAGANPDGTLSVRGTSPNVVVHDMTFDMTGINGGRMVSWGNPNDETSGGGVFYNCTWYNPTSSAQGIGLYGKRSPFWVDNPDWGSAATKYIENSTFNFAGGMGDGALDAYAGAKGVFRYNRVIGTMIGWHGNDSVALWSGHSFEIYNNTFSSPSYRVFTGIMIRGGTALIYSNTFDSNYPSTFLLSHYRGCGSWWLATWGTNKWCRNGYPGDGSYDASGYPCQQQPGTTGAGGLTNWPVMEWNNSHNGGANNMGFANNANFVAPLCTSPYTQKDHVKEERDFLNHSTCSDGIDNDGDGNVDMGDSQCATFWDGNLKKAQNYTPLQYPHPLRGLTTSGTSSPATTDVVTTTSTTTPTTIVAGTSTATDATIASPLLTVKRTPFGRLKKISR